MERTDLREAFFAEVKRDPYTHMVAQLCSQVWAEGYEQALRDAEALLEDAARERPEHEGGAPLASYLQAARRVEDMRRSRSFSDRCDDAIEFMTDARKKAKVDAIIAMANLGSLLGPKAFPDA